MIAPSCGAAVKAGRVVDATAADTVSRPCLDGGEHGGRLACVGMCWLLLEAAFIVDR